MISGAHTLPMGAGRAIPICHIMTADLWAGAEVQLATTASYLLERPDVQLSVVLMNDGRLANELRRLGVDVTVVDERRHGSFRILVVLARFLRDRRINLVHTHRYKDSVLGTIAAKLAGVPFVVRTVHGLREPMTGWNRMKFRLYETLDQATVLSLGDLVIAVSKRMAETLRDSGYRPTMVTHIHNGIDLRKVIAGRSPVDVRRELHIPSDALLIGTVGRLSPVKGHSEFLHAARAISDKRPDARFLVVGTGPLERELQRTASELGLASSCLFLGARSDVYDLMSAMDVFVLPSLAEGIPMAILEAMALGRPIVATAVGGVPEVIQHDLTGLLVEAGNATALAGACLTLSSDPLRAQALGMHARQAVEERFSSDRYGRALVDAYRSVTLIPKTTPRFARAVAEDRPKEGPRQEHADAIAPLVLRTFWRILVKVMRLVMRAITHAFERRRTDRMRRQPAAVTSALRRAQTILVLCKGNIIRSPFAASLLARELRECSSVSVRSAGLQTISGRPADPMAITVAARLGVDLTGHASTPLDRQLVETSDVIFVMDVPQLVALRRQFAAARGKSFLLTALAPDKPLEVRDPLGAERGVFRTCFGHISGAVDPIVRILSDSVMPS
jgi:L-malate glycosyltransferase